MVDELISIDLDWYSADIIYVLTSNAKHCGLQYVGQSGVPLLQVFIVCASVVWYVAFGVCSVTICSSSLLLLVPREGCTS